MRQRSKRAARLPVTFLCLCLLYSSVVDDFESLTSAWNFCQLWKIKKLFMKIPPLVENATSLLTLSFYIWRLFVLVCFWNIARYLTDSLLLLLLFSLPVAMTPTPRAASTTTTGLYSSSLLPRIIWSQYYNSSAWRNPVAKKVKVAERRVPKLIPVLGSQPTGDVSHKPGGRLPLLSARPSVTPATLKRSAINFVAWWTEAQWVWTVCLRLLPDSIAAAIWTKAFLRLSPAL